MSILLFKLFCSSSKLTAIFVFAASLVKVPTFRHRFTPSSFYSATAISLFIFFYANSIGFTMKVSLQQLILKKCPAFLNFNQFYKFCQTFCLDIFFPLISFDECIDLDFMPWLIVEFLSFHLILLRVYLQVLCA